MTINLVSKTSAELSELAREVGNCLGTLRCIDEDWQIGTPAAVSKRRTGRF
jgi:hypothetical protein